MVSEDKPKNGKQQQTADIQIERMWTTETLTYYQSTQEKKQAHLVFTRRPMPICHSGHLFGGMSIPNVSIDHQGFAGTITHMDGMIRKRRQRETYRVHVHKHK